MATIPQKQPETVGNILSVMTYYRRLIDGLKVVDHTLVANIYRRLYPFDNYQRPEAYDKVLSLKNNIVER